MKKQLTKSPKERYSLDKNECSRLLKIIVKIDMRTYNPYWYKLIKKLKREDKVKTGPTLSYVLGAYKLLDEPISDFQTICNN